MTPGAGFSEAQLRRIDELCVAAMGIDGDREAFLRGACPDDDAIRAEVARILAGTSGTELLGEPLRLPYIEPEAASEGVPDRIGRYEIRRVVGQGGFGVVYEAAQVAPVRRRVALKLLKPGLDSTEILARFRLERQALAMMEHPGIARMLDAGESEGGRPYFVMEFVDGAPITSFCGAEGMGVRARLEMFLRLCDAVQHAHIKGVIHRDLKPSNVLAWRRETGDAAVKVIDFGIAKAVEGSESTVTLRTMGSSPLGTPAFMSPEQIGVGAGDVDVRADVYSLGAVLYQLLAGREPFGPDAWGPRDFAAMQRVVGGVVPARPSARVRDVEAPAPGLPAGPELARRLRGELDWIVMRCLEKDRDRRYQSVDQLARDVRRSLDGEAVEARPPSRAYRLRKLVGRHRAVFGVAGAATVVLVGSVVAVSVALGLATRRERELVDENRRLAGINQFLSELFRAPSSWRQVDADRPASELRVRDVLEASSERIGPLFADDPTTAAAMRVTLGNSFLDLGQVEEARAQLELGLAIIEHDREGFAYEAANLANLKGQILANEGMFAEALGAFRGGREIAARHGLVYGQVVNGNGETQCLFRLGRLDDAQASAERIADLASSEFGYDHVETAIALNNLGSTLRAHRRYDEALEVFRRGDRAFIESHNDRHTAALILRDNLVRTLRNLNRFAEASDLGEALLGQRLDVLGPTHPHTIGSMTGVAIDRLDRGLVESALELSALAVASSAEATSVGDHLVVGALATNGLALRASGRADEAEARAREAVEVAASSLGPRHLIRVWAVTVLARCVLDAGRPEEAAALLATVEPPDSAADGRAWLLCRARYLMASVRAETDPARAAARASDLDEARSILTRLARPGGLDLRELELVDASMRASDE